MAGDAPAELYAPAFDFGTDPVPLIELADWFNGLAFKNIDFSTDGLPVVKIAEIKNGISDSTKRTQADYDPRVRLADGDLLFCWSGQPETSIGTFIWSQGDAWLNQHIFRVVAKEAVDPDFLHFLMLYLQPNFQAIAANKQTTGLGHVTKRDLGDILVQLPDIAEQLRIVEVLQPIQERIALAVKMAATLEETAQSLFRSWFVDFDPVQAKAKGIDPGLPTDLADLFPNRFGDDGLPEGWQIKQANEIAELIRDGVEPSELDPSTPYVGLDSMPKRQLGLAAWGNASDVNSLKTRFSKDDLLFGKLRPYFHKVVIAPIDGICSSDIFVFRALEADRRFYFYLAFNDEQFVASASGAATGTRMPRADWKHMGRQRCAIGPSPLMQTFEKLAESFIAPIAVSHAEARSLTELRDNLLPKLISGEVRIASAVDAVAAA